MDKARKLQFIYIEVIKVSDRRGLAFLEANGSIHYLTVFNAVSKYMHDSQVLTRNP